ncbi:MAG: FHA domain-containing protein [Ruminococcus sp.]|nr:FHA domain-containing protein [Ruminococcus sp.]
MRKVYLIGRSGTHANEKFLLEGELIIGRDPQMCQLIYPKTEKNISGVHCKIQEIGDRVCLIDLNSTNGTFFQDGTRLEPDMPRTMTSGQGFYLGSRENFFDLVIEEEVEEGRRGRWSKPQGGRPETNQAAASAAPAAARRNSPATAVVAVLLVVVIAVAGVLGYSYYQESQKSTFERMVDDFSNGTTLWDSITNLF